MEHMERFTKRTGAWNEEVPAQRVLSWAHPVWNDVVFLIKLIRFNCRSRRVLTSKKER